MTGVQGGEVCERLSLAHWLGNMATASRSTLCADTCTPSVPIFCVAYDCRKQVVGLSTRHDSCRRDGVSKLHTTIVGKNRIVYMGL